MSHQLLNEGLRPKDLEYLVGNKIHFDEYESKMGDPDDVITVSFKIKQRMPSEDLVSFIENGYDWVLDADVSSGEIEDGEFLVFVEMPRRSRIFEQLVELLDDLQHLTDIKLNEWKFRWYKQKEYHSLNEAGIGEIVPDSPTKYRQYVEQFEGVQQEQASLADELSTIKKLSGIK
jgi:hypothetical protein